MRKKTPKKGKDPRWEPNPRIELFMRKAGMDETSLGRAIGEKQQTISKLILGELRLRWDHLERLGEVLGVHPMRLVGAIAALKDQVAPMEGARLNGRRNVTNYRATDNLEEGGIHPGDSLAVEAKEAATGDIVLASIGHADRKRQYKMLFQFLAPASLVASDEGFIYGYRLDDPEFSVELLGVVIAVIPPPQQKS